MENPNIMKLKRGIDKQAIKGSSLLFWSFLALILLLTWCVICVFVLYSIINEPSSQKLWILGIVFFAIAALICIKFLPKLILALVREVFCTYTINISNDEIEVRWSSVFYSGIRRFKRNALRVGWFGCPLVPVLAFGKGEFVFGSLFTKANWDDVEKLLNEGRAEPVSSHGAQKAGDCG